MGLDPFSPVAPARVRCLLLPCGRIQASRYSTFVERLKQNLTVRLSDVSPNDGAQRNMFSPLAFPTGIVVYEMSASSPSPSHRSLIPFELYREPLVVLGIADGKQYYVNDENGVNSTLGSRSVSPEADDGTLGRRDLEQLSESATWIKENHSSSLVHRVLVFDLNESISSVPASLIPIPTAQQSKSTTMKTIMCDVTSLLLVEMTSYAKSLQALTSIDTPASHNEELVNDQGLGRSTSRPPSRQAEDVSRSSSPAASSPPPTKGIARHPYRASLPAHLSALPTDTPSESTTPSGVGEVSRTPLVTFDDITHVPGRPAPTPYVGQMSRSRDRVSVQGFGSGSLGERARNRVKCRLGVIIGSMYLLSGRWPDAIRELEESASAARASNDHVWHAKALDYILVTLLMFAWAGLDFEIPQVCYPLGERPNHVPKPGKQVSSGTVHDLGALKSPNSVNRLVSLQNLCNLLPDLVNHILHLYARAAMFTSDQIPQISFSESVLRFAKLLALVQASFGIIDDMCLQTVVTSTQFSKKGSVPEHLESFLSRSEIASTLFRAIPNPGMERTLEVADRLHVLAGVASILSFLEYHRKKAFILRELVSLLLPALVQSRKDSAAELGLHPAASLASLEMDISYMGVDGYLEHTEHGLHGESGVRALLIAMCKVYGIILLSSAEPEVVSTQANSTHVDQAGPLSAHRASSQAIKRSFGSLHLKMDVLRYCINLCEALPDLRGIISFSSDLLNTFGSGVAAAPNGDDAHPKLPMEDQARLASNISRSINAAEQLGLFGLEAEYWDEFLVRDIEILSPSIADLPILRQKRDLQLASLKDTEKATSPFIYNPFGAKIESSAQVRTILLGERAVFAVTVQNPYDVDLEIEWIKLDAKDSKLNIQAREFVIGPFRTQKVQLSGIVTMLGEVSIKGCIAKVSGCRPRQFPLFRDSWKPIEDRKVKWIGLSMLHPPKERPLSSDSNPGRDLHQARRTMPAPSVLVVNVIENQPTLEVQDTSLSQFTATVLEGESKTFTITLENTSDKVVDLILFKFSDSTSNLLQSVMRDKNLSPAEMYEAETAAYQKPTFKWVLDGREEDQRIEPRSTRKFQLSVLGKPGLSHGTIQISYGHLGVPRSDVGEHIHVRQLSIPISITVNASIDLMRNSVLPFTGDFAWMSQRQDLLQHDHLHCSQHSEEYSQVLNKLGLEHNGSDHCLIFLDFFNSWSKTLALSLQVRTHVSGVEPSDSSKPMYTVHETVQPGSACRFPVLLPRFALGHRHAPIPSIDPKNKRQFVLSASRISPKLERLSRELFWYREEILKYLQADWVEPGTDRRGHVQLRNLQLTPQMMESIKLEDFGIELSVSTSVEYISDQSVRQVGRSRFCLSADTFVTVNIRLINRLSHPIHPLLRLQPDMHNQLNNIALDLSKKIAFNGLLQRALPPIAAGGSLDVSMGMVFLCAGEYEMGASIEEVRTWRSINEDKGTSTARSRAGTGDYGLSVTEGIERRTWYAKEPCLIEVVGSPPDELDDEDD